MIGWFKRKQGPGGPYAEYLKQDFGVTKAAPIEDLNFVVLDCEMTGLGKSAELVSIGAVMVRENRINVSEVLDLKFDFAKGNATSEIHGELSKPSRTSPIDSIEQILSFLGNRIVVGHSIAIDIGQLNRLFQSANAKLKLKNKVLDTYHLMTRIDPMRFERAVAGQRSLRLDALCEEMEVPIENRHTALGDAYLTAQVFLKILSRLKQRKVLRAGELLK